VEPVLARQRLHKEIRVVAAVELEVAVAAVVVKQ